MSIRKIKNTQRLGNVYGDSFGQSFWGGDRQICAMRGRNPDNPTSREKCENLEQRLEIRPDGMSNCITSVDKDNYVLEQNAVRIGTDEPTEKPKTIKVRQATKEGFIEVEIPGVVDLNYPTSNTRRGRVIRGGADMSDSYNGEYP